MAVRFVAVPAGLLREAARGWREHRTGLMAPGLAFYTLLSSAPLLLLAIAVARRTFGGDEVRARLIDGLHALGAGTGADTLVGLLAESGQDPGRWTAEIVGLAVVVYAASRLFSVLRGALGVVWERPAADTRREALLDILRHQGFAVAMVAGVLALWFAGLVLSLVLASATAYVRERAPEALRGLTAVHLVVSLAFPALACAFVYRSAPGARVRWAHAWLGGAFAATLLAGGQKLLGLLVARWALPGLFGAAGTLVLVLIWYQAMWALFLFGAEFTRALGERDAG